MSSISKTKTYFAVILILALLSISIYIFYLFDVRGINKDVMGLLGDLSFEIERENRLKSVKAIVQDTEEERERLLPYFVDPSNIVVFIESIESLARTAGISLEINSVSIKEAPPGGHPFVEVRLDTDGDFSSTAHFLLLIEELPMEISIERSFIEKNEEAGVWEGVYIIRAVTMR